MASCKKCGVKVGCSCRLKGGFCTKCWVEFIKVKKPAPKK